MVAPHTLCAGRCWVCHTLAKDTHKQLSLPSLLISRTHPMDVADADTLHVFVEKVVVKVPEAEVRHHPSLSEQVWKLS